MMMERGVKVQHTVVLQKKKKPLSSAVVCVFQLYLECLEYFLQHNPF